MTNCPIPQVDGMSIDGLEVADGIYAIGKLHWQPDLQEWRCLANVYGTLAVIQVRVEELS